MGDKQQTLDQVDAMLAELGLDGAESTPAVTATATASPSISRGPGVSAGPGISSGPGVSRGPGVSSGPGISRGPGVSSGPGMSRGPGISSGPGAGRGVSSGPGAAMMGGRPMATHTPDGRPIQFSGPPCAACNEMVIGPVTNALDKQWHPECFVCMACRKPFKSGNFVEHDGKPYCDDDFNNLFGPKCAGCLKPVTDKCINAVGKTYHPECFYCAGCGTELRGKPYKEDEGEPYCLVCKAARSIVIDPAAGICGKCKKPIIGEYITIQGQRMHPEHFRCEECGCEFRGGNCHEYEGKLYCYPDYLKLLKSICAHCQKPIIGRSVTALGKVWHPEHFMCFTCKDPFAGSSFYEHLGKPYCELHYLQQFGKVCHTCNKPIADNGIAAMGKHYHQEHFVCGGCSKPLGKEIFDNESKPFCKSCYNALPKEVRKRLEKKKEGELKAQKAREKEAKKAMKGK